MEGAHEKAVLNHKKKPINISSQYELSTRKCDSGQFTISINAEDSDVDINLLVDLTMWSNQPISCISKYL